MIKNKGEIKLATKSKNSSSGKKKQTVKSGRKPAASSSGTPKSTAKGKKTPANAMTEEQIKTKKNKAKQTKAILLCAFAVFIFFLILEEGSNVWTLIHNVLIGTLGSVAFALPVLLLFVAVIIALERETSDKARAKVLLAIGTVFSISTLIYVVNNSAALQNLNYFQQLQSLYSAAVLGSGAGALSGIIGIPLVYLFGQSGAQIFTIIALVLCVVFLFGITIKHIINFVKKPADKVYNGINSARESYAKRREEQQRVEEQPQKQRNNAGNSRQPSLFENEDFLTEENRYINTSPESDEKTIKRRNKKGSSIDIPLDEERTDSSDLNTRRERLKELMNQPDIKPQKPEEKTTNPLATFAAKTVMAKKKTPKKPDPQQLQPDPQSVSVELESPQEEKKTKVREEDGYCYPPVELLHPNFESVDKEAYEELESNSKKLESTLESFGVRAEIINICRGPSVTRFELQPAAGVKISKITNLADDIALNLAANGVRIEAPIPGKAAIGIEVPNKTVSMVTMRELIDSKEFKKEKSKLTVVLGRDISGNIVATDLAKMPHLLIAGTTGSGKSVCVNSILLSLLYKGNPNEVKLLLIDPKMVEFSKYKGIPHLLIPVVADVKKAAGALNWAVSEMLERYKTFAAYNVRDIHSYNRMIDNYKKKYANLPPDLPKEDRPMTDDGLPIPETKMPQIVIAIDELADLMMAAPNEVEESICRLAQMARAAGMHLVIATQRPSVNVITGVIKANIPSRIALKTSSQIDSRTILDVGGAEKLIGRGDMLFSPVGAAKPLRVQGCYASDEEIENVTGYIKSSHHSEYNEEIVEQIEKIAATELKSGGKDNSSQLSEDDDETRDPMLEEAIKLVVEAGQASTSLLQRRLRLGYARAGRLIDEMEQMGIVGPHEGSKSRQVLMTHQEWLERQNMKAD